MKNLLLTLTVMTSFSTFAQEMPKNLDELLLKVKKERIDNQKQLSQREAKFLKEKKEQASALAIQKKELKRLEEITAQLQKKFEENEKEVGKLEDSLRIAKGNLGEMFGVVKQIAGDFKGQFQNSNISAQFPGRDKFMAQLAESGKLPNATDLEKLFYEIQRELTESGKVVKFQTAVVTPDGQKSDKTVTRVGAFNLVADGQYLSYQSETDQVLVLPRQPQGKYLSMI